MKRKAVFAVSFLALLSGCGAGNVVAPKTPGTIAAPVHSWSQNVDGEAEVTMDWWKGLQDPQLDKLVGEALARNADLRAAQANLRATQALVREAKSARLPSGGLTGSVERNRTPAAALQLDTVGGPSVLPTQTLGDIGGALSWELDLSGRIAASIETAGADRDKALWSERSVQAATAAAVVRAWLDLGEAREITRILDLRIANLEEIHRALAVAYRAGGNRVDARDKAAADLELLRSERAQVATLERNALRRLSTLTGHPAPAGLKDLAELAPMQLPVPQYATAPNPEALLRLRPDVAMAELELLKAGAAIKIAKSELYPRISFGGSAGLTATPGDMLDPGAVRFGIGPSFSWGIFDLPRIRSRIRAAGATADAAAASWEGAFLRAIEETDSALDQFSSARRGWEAAATQAELANRDFARSQLRLSAGQDSRLTHAQVIERQLSALAQSAQARASALRAWSSVQIAFGAGWRPKDS